jgi:hypothetical protein
VSDDARLYRVWIEGHWTLVKATDTDAVYKSFRPRKRAKITRVDLVRKTSEGLIERQAARDSAPKKRIRARG